MTTTISQRDQALDAVITMRSAQDDYDAAVRKYDAEAVQEAVDRYKEAMLWLAERHIPVRWDERGRPWLYQEEQIDEAL